MIPRFANTQSDDVGTLRKDVLDMSQQFGHLAGAKALGVFALATTVTRIPHGQVVAPHWLIYDGPDVAATVYQTAPADRAFLYLAASVACNVGVAIF